MARALLHIDFMRPFSLIVVATFVTTIFVGTASAEPPASADAARFRPPSMMAPVKPPPHRSGVVVTAIGSSLTLATVGLSLYRYEQHERWVPAFFPSIILLAFAPTPARLYAGELGGRHLLWRLGGLLTIAAGSGIVERMQGGSGGLDSPGGAVIGAGAAIVVAATVTDLVTAHRAADRFNARHAIGVAPVSVAPSGTLVAGLSLSGRF